ncbi:hypothetical protein PsorP6_018507 [Peronosclerospora sorghi]|nr:hypothetical protein PsorP6_018507 [Peronosclerospora sorghi]
MSAPFSRSQTLHKSKSLHSHSRKTPPQLAILRFSREEKYISIHLKGLSVDPKINNKTLHIWHILHRLHGRKKTKFFVRTLIKAYFLELVQKCNMRSKFR